MIAICARCRERRAYFADVHGDCDGLGSLECFCGGDLCICHNHGAAKCPGCPECEPTVALADDDSWPHGVDADDPGFGRAADTARPQIRKGARGRRLAPARAR